MNNIVIVFTSEPKSVLLKKSGSGDWAANITQLSSAKFLLCIHNDKMKTYYSLDDDIDDIELARGQAFYIGRINQVTEIDTEDGKKRKFIGVSEYAFLPNEESYKNAWEKLTNNQRNPVTYKDLDEVCQELGIKFEELNWEQAVNLSENHLNSDETDPNFEKVDNFSSITLSDLINEARDKIAKVAGVPANKVNIEIDFKK